MVFRSNRWAKQQRRDRAGDITWPRAKMVLDYRTASLTIKLILSWRMPVNMGHLLQEATIHTECHRRVKAPADWANISTPPVMRPAHHSHRVQRCRHDSMCIHTLVRAVRYWCGEAFQKHFVFVLDFRRASASNVH